MSDAQPLINRVAISSLVVIDLAGFKPKNKISEFDIHPFLVQGIALMEKPFRAALAELNWDDFKGKDVAVFCSSDAIIPMWAYMLIASYLQPFAKKTVFGNPQILHDQLFTENIRTSLDPRQYEGKKVVIKGCGDTPIPPSAYIEATNLLRPFVASLMYGEPCSTVPVFKQKKEGA